MWGASMQLSARRSFSFLAGCYFPGGGNAISLPTLATEGGPGAQAPLGALCPWGYTQPCFARPHPHTGESGRSRTLALLRGLKGPHLAELQGEAGAD